MSEPANYILFNHINIIDEIARHRIDGHVIEGMVKKIVSGIVREQGFFKKGLKEGPWENYRSNKKLRQRRYYLNGILNGSHEWFHTNGNIREIGQYKNGERIGIWLSFDRFGNLTSSVNAGDLEKKLGSKKKSDDPNFGDSPIAWDESLSEFNERHILFRDEVALYKSDEDPVTGVFLKKYSDASIKVVGVYKNGFKHGLWREFRSNKRLKLNCNFKNGKLNGIWEWFNPNGTIREKGAYEDGIKIGIWEERDSQGQLTNQINLDSKVPVSEKRKPRLLKTPEKSDSRTSVSNARVLQLFEHEIFFREGILCSMTSDSHIQGRFVSRKPNGNIIESGQCEAGIKQGQWKKFREDGQLRQKLHFKDGKLDGLWEWFHENGQIREKGLYKNGKRIGKWRSYDRFGSQTKTIIERDETGD